MSSTPAPKAPSGRRLGGVAMLALYYHPVFGGAGVQARRLTDELRGRGWPAFVVTSRAVDRPRKDTVDGTTVLRVPTFRATRHGLFSLFFFLGAVVELVVRVRQWTVLHVHTVGPFVWFPLKLARMLGRPVIVKMTLMGGDDAETMSRGRFARLSRRVFEQASAVVSISEPMSNAYRATGLDSSKLHTMPQGVDVERYRPASAQERREVRQSLGLSEQGPWLVCVGAVSQRKATNIAVDAFIALAKDRPDLRLALVGMDDTTYNPLDMPEEREFALALKQSLDTAKLADRVIFTGVVDNVEDYLRAADVFLFPSLREGFGTVMVEAMACGIPSVVNSIEGIAATVYQHGVDGIILDRKPGEDWAREIAALLDDPERAHSMGEAARETAVRRYSFQVVCDRYEELYASLLPQGSDAPRTSS